MAKEIYLEDVHSIGLEATKLIESRLKEFGIELKPGQDDEIYVPMIETLERISKATDYKSRN